MQRTLALGAALAMILVLMFLTLTVAFQHGVDVLVVVSFVLLAILGFGVLGAIWSAND
jgi:uncharacterized membrane protein